MRESNSRFPFHFPTSASLLHLAWNSTLGFLFHRHRHRHRPHISHNHNIMSPYIPSPVLTPSASTSHHLHPLTSSFASLYPIQTPHHHGNYAGSRTVAVFVATGLVAVLEHRGGGGRTVSEVYRKVKERDERVERQREDGSEARRFM